MSKTQAQLAVERLARRKCPICQGKGETRDAMLAWDIPGAEIPKCTDCQGTGLQFQELKRDCTQCGGKHDGCVAVSVAEAVLALLERREFWSLAVADDNGFHGAWRPSHDRRIYTRHGPSSITALEAAIRASRDEV